MYKVANTIEEYIHNQQVIQGPRHLSSQGSSIPQRVVLIPVTSASSGNLEEIQIIRLYPRYTESETMAVGPSNLCLHEPPGDSCVHYSLRVTLPQFHGHLHPAHRNSENVDKMQMFLRSAVPEVVYITSLHLIGEC